VNRNGTARSRSLHRSIAAMAIGALTEQPPINLIERNYPQDHLAATITRGASSPTSTTSGGGDLLGGLAANFLSGLAPASAASRLFALCTQLNFDGVHTFSVPYPATTPPPVFVGEGAAMPVAQGTIQRVIVGPVRKMLVAVAFAGELEFANLESATAIIGRTLTEQAGRSLDAVLFDNAAGSAVRPAGLLNGMSTLGATAGGGVVAMATDLGEIAKALAAAGVDPDRTVVVASPARRKKI
jgi:hypothetical protein